MRQRGFLALAAAAFAAFLFPATTEGQRGQQVQLPDGPGKAMVEGTCAKCHGLNFMTNSFGFTRSDMECGRPRRRFGFTRSVLESTCSPSQSAAVGGALHIAVTAAVLQ